MPRKSRTSLARYAFFAVSIALLLLACVARAEWEPEIKLSVDEGSTGLNENMGQCIVAKGDTVHAVWADLQNKGQGIYYRRSTDKGATWGPTTRLSPTPGVDTSPLIALSGNTVHVVFLRHTEGGQSESFYKHSTDGGATWGDDVSLGKTKWWPGVAASGTNVFVTLNTVFDDEPQSSVVYFRRSSDNGVTWDPQKQISEPARREKGRCEDPAISADGKNVSIVWNDNRDSEPGKGMSVYYRHSADLGATWGSETALTKAPAYTYFPTIFITGPHAEVAFGDRQSGHYDIYHLHSADSGATWGPAEQITNTPNDEEFYPAITRDGANVHLMWMSKIGIMYQRSSDDGKTWEPAINLTKKGNSPFLTVAGDAVHVLFVSRRDGHQAIYYKRNPTGNKPGPTPAPQ